MRGGDGRDDRQAQARSLHRSVSATKTFEDIGSSLRTYPDTAVFHPHLDLPVHGQSDADESSFGGELRGIGGQLDHGLGHSLLIDRDDGLDAGLELPRMIGADLLDELVDVVNERAGINRVLRNKVGTLFLLPLSFPVTKTLSSDSSTGS